ncbi:MAG: calcium/sodium antiporter [Pseudomonadota bacterium]
MTILFLSLIAGLALLVWSADRFIAGAVGLAHYYKLPPIVIGVVIVGFGTSAPELLISGVAAWNDNSGLAVGNAIGSNITNIALVLGVTALLTPIVVSENTLKREFPVLFAAMGLSWFFLSDGVLSLDNALLLLLTLIIALGYLAWAAKNDGADLEEPEYFHSLRRSIFWSLAGLVLLLISSEILVHAATNLAKAFGVSDLVIGLSIVAIGTSLPELAASVTGAIKHHTDIAIGNILGSNIFNILGVIGVPGLIQTYTIPKEVFVRDLPVMLGLTIILFIFSFATRKGNGMFRLTGIIFLLCFIAFETTLYIQSVPN